MKLQRQSRAPFALSTALVLGGLTGCGSINAQDGRPSQDLGTYTLTADLVSIYNLAGSAELVSHAGPDVLVEVRRRGGEGARLRVEVDEIDGREALRIIYPDDRIRYPEGPRGGGTQVRVNDDGTFGNDGGFFMGGGRVRVSGSGGGTEAWADLRVLVPDGRDVALYMAVGETTVDGVRGTLFVDTATGTVRTARTAGSLRVDTGSGRIEVQDAVGEVHLDTGSGGVEANGIRGSLLFVDTGSGSVRGERIEVDALRVDTGSGRARFTGVAAPDISVDTGSGSVGLGLVSDVDRLVVETGSGSVQIRVPQDLGADVTIRTGSGGIDADVPVQIRSSRRGRFEGVIGDGNGQIRIETNSGGVDILPA